MKNIIYSDRFLNELDKTFDYVFEKKQDFFATQKYIKNLKNEIYKVYEKEILILGIFSQSERNL